MRRSQEALLCYLPFDRVEQQRAADASGRALEAFLVAPAPEVLPDEQMGAATRFDGESGGTRVPNLEGAQSVSLSVFIEREPEPEDTQQEARRTVGCLLDAAGLENGFVRTDGISCQRHPFQDSVRIAFQNQPVLKRPGL